MGLLTVERLEDKKFRVSGDVTVTEIELYQMIRRLELFPSMQYGDGDTVGSVPKLICDDERER